MLNAVRVFDSKGNLKNVFSSKFLSKRHWKIFEESEKNKFSNSYGQDFTPKWVKEKLDIKYIRSGYLNDH